MGKQLSYLIIGNGIAGVTAAEILRSEDTTSSITIIADDPFPVYYRPALKDYLGGRVNEEKLWARPSTFYQEQRIRFVPGRVMGINTVQSFVQLHNGQQLGYHKLLLANGARPRRLSCPGLDLVGVSTLRTVADYQEIMRRLDGAKRIVVCGSGTLALESAEALNHRGYKVVHLLRQHTLWSEVLDPVASDLVLQEELRDGIDVRTEEEIAEIVGRKGQVTEVITTSEARIPCDMVLIAIGIKPHTGFIQASGIACGLGVKVDKRMRTNVPNIYAAGDVIETTDATTGRTRVIGQWYPAIQQARTAAYSMLDLLDPRSTTLPGSNYYNATFLYGLDFVSVGTTVKLPNAHHYQEITADPQPRNYRKVILNQGIPLGALFLGDRKNALAFKRAIDHRINLAPIASYLFVDGFNLDEWLDRQGVAPVVFDFERMGRDEGKGEGAGWTPARRSQEGPYYEIMSQSPKAETIGGGRLGDEALIDSAVSHIIPDAILAKLNDAPALVLASQGADPRVVSLEYERRYVLGRDRENNIILDDIAASRRHAEIFSAPDGFYVRDLDSRNGVIVNKVKINNAYHLSHRDRVVIGNTLAYFSYPQASSVMAHVGASSRSKTDFRAMHEKAIFPQVLSKEAVVEGMGHRTDVQKLTDEHIRFEIDMCIGCDRCMDACPVPMSTLVNIANLNHATISKDITAHIAHFTHECIMCGSCVPVCPVDNHRDLLMLSLKQRLGVSWDGKADVKRIAENLPGGWIVEHLISHLRQHRILSDGQLVPENYLLHMAAASKLRILAPGDTVIREGDYGRDLYLILEGRLAISTNDIGDTELPVAILSRGEHVGEDGMLTGHPYKVTARAQVPTLIMQVPEQVMQRLMELVPNVRSYFDQVNNARSLKSILKRMALFQGVSDTDIHALIQQTPLKQYERNERLFAEDDPEGRPSRETLHILLEGFVKVARHTMAGTGHHKSDERIIAYRQGGDYFAGGLDLLGDGRAVSVTAINRVRVAEVPRQFMVALFQKYPEVNQRFALRLREYLESSVSTQGYVLISGPLKDLSPSSKRPDAAAQAGLHSLVSDGVVEGTEVLVIDLDKCIHCSECEEACARRHGHSRMNRKGMVVGNISIATACRQCQDPVCLLCSRAGIARHPNGEVYITESCIGCGICADRCPYGAISIMNVEEEPVSSSSWQRFSNFFKGTSTAGKGNEHARKNLVVLDGVAAASSYAAPGPLNTFQPGDPLDEMRKKIAIKCDLCAGYKDQACVEACPTGAAIRIQPTNFFGSTEEILRRRAL